MSVKAKGESPEIRLPFRVGDCVRILTTVSTPFAGLQGIIEQTIPHPRNLSQLDAYIVSFEWGEKQKFWSVQLELSQRKAV